MDDIREYKDDPEIWKYCDHWNPWVTNLWQNRKFTRFVDKHTRAFVVYMFLHSSINRRGVKHPDGGSVGHRYMCKKYHDKNILACAYPMHLIAERLEWTWFCKTDQKVKPNTGAVSKAIRCLVDNEFIYIIDKKMTPNGWIQYYYKLGEWHGSKEYFYFEGYFVRDIASNHPLKVPTETQEELDKLGTKIPGSRS